MAKKSPHSIIPAEVIEHRIYLIRNHKVLFDRDLAELYGVDTRVLNQAVKRNRERFPDDFMFQLTAKETENLRSHIVTSRWGGRRYLPYAFTEQGVAMLSTVLKSRRAIQVSIAIMRTFVRLRRILATHKELAKRLVELETKYDAQFKVVFEVIQQLMEPPSEPDRPLIGFAAE
jgi:hypothetical protein